MLRFTRIACGLLVGLGLVSKVSAFSLLGTLEDWQTLELNHISDTFPGSQQMWYGEELAGTKQTGQEYRINSPTLTYGFDEAFVNFFGASGMAAVDKAMAILNKLPAASKASADLSEFPTEDVQMMNYRAQNAQLFDVKSIVLSLMLEHLGLADSRAHIYDLRSRWLIPNAGPCDFRYGVVMRNYDPVTYEASEYLNGIQYNYGIDDGCTYGEAYAAATEYVVTSGAIDQAPVSSLRSLKPGGFYNQLSRDDMGGLRYIYRFSNFNNESLPPGSIATLPTGRQPVNSPWNIANPAGTNTVTTNAVNLTSTNNLGLFCGVEKIQFVRQKTTSVMGNTFVPMTIKYTQSVIVSNKTYSMSVSRTATRPDIVFSAADLSNIPDYDHLYSRTLTLVNNSDTGNPGPGNIMPQTIITFNNAGLIFLNYPNHNDQADAEKSFRWASFDESNADPIIYPSSLSISAVEKLVLKQQ